VRSIIDRVAEGLLRFGVGEDTSVGFLISNRNDKENFAQVMPLIGASFPLQLP